MTMPIRIYFESFLVICDMDSIKEEIYLKLVDLDTTSWYSNVYSFKKEGLTTMTLPFIHQLILSCFVSNENSKVIISVEDPIMTLKFEMEDSSFEMELKKQQLETYSEHRLDYYDNFYNILSVNTEKNPCRDTLCNTIFRLVLRRYVDVYSESVVDFLQDVAILKNIGFFTKYHMEILLKHIVENVSVDVNRINFSLSRGVRARMISEFRVLCNEMIALGVNILQFLKFVLILSIKTTDDIESVFLKRHLFMRHGELCISQVIEKKFNFLQIENPDWLEIRCLGEIEPDEFTCEKYGIDLYYLEYAKTCCPIIFSL